MMMQAQMSGFSGSMSMVQPEVGRSVSESTLGFPTMKQFLHELQHVDESRVLIIRRLNRLGARSEEKVASYLTSKFGGLEKVMVAHVRAMKPTELETGEVVPVGTILTFASTGFVVMKSRNAAARVLSKGKTHPIGRSRVLFDQFKKQQKHKETVASSVEVTRELSAPLSLRSSGNSTVTFCEQLPVVHTYSGEECQPEQCTRTYSQFSISSTNQYSESPCSTASFSLEGSVNSSTSVSSRVSQSALTPSQVQVIRSISAYELMQVAMNQVYED